MLISLTFLAPALQEILLAGRPEACQLNFHQLLRISRLSSWGEQRATWTALSQGRGGAAMGADPMLVQPR
jgi:hypothetical protein